MKTSVVLLVIALVCPVQADDHSLCRMDKGKDLIAINYETFALEFPCRYNFVRQTCGDYDVSITNGNAYVHPFYFLNSISVSVKKGNETWEGHTDNELSRKFILDDAGDPFSKDRGSMESLDLFNYDKHAGDYFGDDGVIDYGDFLATTKDGALRILFKPYFSNGAGYVGISMFFYCFVPNDPPAFPAQLCGGRDEGEIQTEATKLGLLRYGLYTLVSRDTTVYYHVFTDSTVDQSSERKCGQVVDTMNNVCPNDTQRVEAINRCFRILKSPKHRLCVTRSNSELIDVFYECVKFVCSDFTDKSVCKALGDYIDTCPNFPGLTIKVKECYKGLSVAPDKKKKREINPFAASDH